MPHASTLTDPLIERHMDLARALVRQFLTKAPAHADRDALESDAMLGLVLAARAFDPGRGASFPTYAKRRIIGTMLDGLRARSGGRGQYRKLSRMLSLSMPVGHHEGRTLMLQETLAGRQEAAQAQVDRQDEVQWLMRDLKPSTRLMIHQHYLEEKSQKQISRLHDLRPASISHRIKQARIKMKRKAQLAGIGQE